MTARTGPRQTPPLPEGEALETVQGANSDDNLAELRAETRLLRWLVTDYGYKHPDGANFNDHVQRTLLDFYLVNSDQARAECETAGTPLVAGTIYLDPQDDFD